MSDQPDPPAEDNPRRGFVSLRRAARLLDADPADWLAPARRFPVRWPAAYLALARSEAGLPVRRMGVPDPRELVEDPSDLADPVGERSRSPDPFVVRKHRDRAILLVTARCHFYCRFCFRRAFPDGGHRDPSEAELDRALAGLLGDADLKEIILSGGDPLTLSDERLGGLLGRIGAAPQIDAVRIHTRAPVHFPERITPGLVEVLGRGTPPWMVTHFNHPVELTCASRDALATLRRGGVPLLNQSVLLAGVNDDPTVLEELFRALYRERVKPYYLHHPDRAPGNASFRLTIARGLEIFAAVRARLSGPALPGYVIDMPDGAGKIPVASLETVGPGRYRTPSGVLLDDVLSPR